MTIAAISWILGLLDYTYALLRFLGGPLFPRFYCHGWGRVEEAQSLSTKLLVDIASDCKREFPVTWSETRVHQWRGVIVARGSFESPVAEYLPLEARSCPFFFVSPLRSGVAPWGLRIGKPNRDTKSARPIAVVLLFASTGEQNEHPRLAKASSLARTADICSIIPIAPYYGERRPPGQWFHYLDTVAGSLIQAAAAIREGTVLARHVVEWWDDSVPVCLTGFSWGGAMAATTSIAAALALPENRIPVLVSVPYVGSPGPDIMLDGILAGDIDWKALGKSEKQIDARERLLKVFHSSHLSILIDKAISCSECQRRLRRLEAISAVSTINDKFIVRRQAAEFCRLLRIVSNGGRMKESWISGGHVTAFLRQGRQQKQAILGALSFTLEQKR